MSIVSKDTTFLGYRRENGRVGIRNHVVILPLDDLSNAAAEAVAHNIKGALAIPHPYGRLQFGADLDLHFRTLIGAGCNPNVAAVVVIGIEDGWTQKVAVALDAEADHRLAGGGDAFNHLLGPAVFNADDDHRRDVGVAAGADQGAEVQVEIGAELQPAVGVRDRQRTLDVVRHGLGRRVRQIVQRQDDDVVANADTAVLAPVAEESGVFADDAHAYHLFVLML